MAMLSCQKCHFVWDGCMSPFCPACLNHVWDNTSGFIRPKHDPRLLPKCYDTYRSVVTMDFIVNQQAYVHALAYGGGYYYDTQYGNYTCFINQPLGLTAGSAIPSNYPWPTHPLDSQKVVNIFGTPHVYAVNLADVSMEIASGRLIPPSYCDIPGCGNFSIPGTKRCSRH
jgi:hypothetical protein